MAYRYMPMIKTRAGEVVALHNLTAAAKARILPVLHVCEGVSASFCGDFSTVWSGRAVGVDGSFSFGQTGSTNDFSQVVHALRSGGVSILPVLGYSDPAAYNSAAGALIGADGVIIRCTLGDILSVLGWISQNGAQPADVDLVIDIRDIAALGSVSFAAYVQHTIYQVANPLANFRSVTLVSGAAPKDVSALSLGVNTVPRLDWNLWSTVYPAFAFRLDYGDYCTGNPDITEPPGYAMPNATVSVRYTADFDWIIVKGTRTTGPTGAAMGVQYHGHANTLMADARFGGVPGCWADQRIAQAAVNSAGIGSRTKWSEIMFNRHISLVADRLP